MWGPVRYKFVAGAVTLTSFLFHFPLFSPSMNVDPLNLWGVFPSNSPNTGGDAANASDV